VKKLIMLIAALPLMAGAASRVVTLGGDVTEIAWALGAGPQLVARDSTSTWPQQAQALPDVGYPKRNGADRLRRAGGAKLCRAFRRRTAAGAARP